MKLRLGFLTLHCGAPVEPIDYKIGEGWSARNQAITWWCGVSFKTPSGWCFFGPAIHSMMPADQEVTAEMAVRTP